MDEKLIIWLKQKEIEALGRKKQLLERGDDYFKYFDGKAQAYSEVWERLLAAGGRLHPSTYNELNEHYSELANTAAIGG